MFGNAFSDLFAYLVQLMTTNASMFEAMGVSMYRSFTVIVLVWFGIQWALRGGMQMDKFAGMILTISFGFAMVQFYSRPIPGLGYSFYHLIIDQGNVLANQLSQSMVAKVLARLDLLYNDLETPGISTVLNVVEGVRWLVTVLAILAAEVAVFGVISFGYIASAVCVLMGPIFIPFFILPKMEWMFWGWLKATMQYAFYPVVAHAYVFVGGSLLINFVDRAGTDLSGPRLGVVFLALVMMLIAFTWGLLKVPQLCNSMFSGKSGESAVPGF